jgi:hypothetical protein
LGWAVEGELKIILQNWLTNPSTRAASTASLMMKTLLGWFIEIIRNLKVTINLKD